MGTGEQWKNETSLTLSLLNCISPRLPQASNFVSVSFISDDSDIVELSHIQINYAVDNILNSFLLDILWTSIYFQIPWPVSLIINQDSLKKYNSVFRFLLNIKRALISLQRSSFKGQLFPFNSQSAFPLASLDLQKFITLQKWAVKRVATQKERR